jgi:hypothetical protein
LKNFGVFSKTPEFSELNFTPFLRCPRCNP